MCGITGICHLRGPADIHPETLGRMAGILNHRGPDESGIYIDDQTGLGHARLSVIDLTSGTQPIHNETKTLWMVYNGEIFNYPELREQLVKDGHRFYTATDTEVIIHLFEEKNVHCLDLLNGQFAFAIWDSIKKELFLACDRLGICPLHYTVNNDGTFYFASEIKALFTVPGIPREIDPIALDQIFTYWTTLPQTAAFKNIHALAPGHFLHIADGRILIQKYWDFPLYPRGAYIDQPPSEICERLKILLADAVRIRLKSDVPVGAYLSGGLDSSGITALIAKECNNSIQTFGIRFEETDFDESLHQKKMAEYLNVEHKELFVPNKAIAEHFAAAIWHCEKPILRTAPVPLYLLSKLVSDNGLKVIVSGEGADEIFGGYNIFKEALIRKFCSHQPCSSIRPALLKQIYPHIFKNPKMQNTVVNFFLQGLDNADDPLFSHLVRWNNTRRIKTFFSKDVHHQIGTYDSIQEMRDLLPENFHEYDSLSKAQFIETKLFLGNYLLSSQGDRVAMAHSVEARPPYLDHRIIEFMAKVPTVWKILGLNEKYILKKTFQDILPESIVSRAKMPYRAPIQQSFCTANHPEYIKEILSEKNIKNSGYFDVKKTTLLFKKMQAQKNTGEVDDMAFAGILSTLLIDSQFVKNFPFSNAYKKPGLLIDHRSGSSSTSLAVRT